MAQSITFLNPDFTGLSPTLELVPVNGGDVVNAPGGDPVGELDAVNRPGQFTCELSETVPIGTYRGLVFIGGDYAGSEVFDITSASGTFPSRVSPGDGLQTVNQFTAAALAQLAGKNFPVLIPSIAGTKLSPIYIGDAYLAAHGRAITFPSAYNLSELAITEITWTLRNVADDQDRHQFTGGSVVSDFVVAFELNSVQTREFIAGTYELDVTLTLSDGNEITIIGRKGNRNGVPVTVDLIDDIPAPEP